MICIFNVGYKDLLSRKEIREAAWRKPGWDECVAYTGNNCNIDFKLRSLTKYFGIFVLRHKVCIVLY